MTVAAHDLNCRHAGQHSDAAKRISDSYNLHLIGAGDSAVGKVFAVRLSDGRSDGVLYADMRDAVLHQHHDETYYAFVRIGPASMSNCEAEGFLNFTRSSRSRRIAEPDRDHKTGGLVAIPRLTVEDQRAQVRSLLFGTAPTNLILPRN